jgi:hypothetical protein
MLWKISKNGVRKRNDCINSKIMIEYPSNGNEMIYKPPVEARVLKLEEENVGMTNELYELNVDIDMLKERIKTLENLILGDGK